MCSKNTADPVFIQLDDVYSLSGLRMVIVRYRVYVVSLKLLNLAKDAVSKLLCDQTNV